MSEQDNGGRDNQPSGEQRNPRLNEPVSRKMASVLELAKYKVGGTVWWVTLRYRDPIPELTEEAMWMRNCHPKALYEHGPYKNFWPLRAKLPRLHHVDFTGIVNIITSEFVVERFNICEALRSGDTGEFFYANQDDEWMPETFLFDTQIAARRERTRVIKMMGTWAESQK